MIVFAVVSYVLLGLCFALFSSLVDDMDGEEFRIKNFVLDVLLWPCFGFLLAMEAYEYYKEKNGEW